MGDDDVVLFLHVVGFVGAKVVKSWELGGRSMDFFVSLWRFWGVRGIDGEDGGMGGRGRMGLMGVIGLV